MRKSSTSAVSFELKEKIDPWIPIAQDVNDLKIRLQPITLPTNLRTYKILGMTLADATPELIASYDCYVHGRRMTSNNFGGAFVLDPGVNLDRVEFNAFVNQGSIFWQVGIRPSGTRMPVVKNVKDFVEQIISTATEQQANGSRLLVCYTCSTLKADTFCTSNMKITKDEIEELKTVLDKLNTDRP